MKLIPLFTTILAVMAAGSVAQAAEPPYRSWYAGFDLALSQAGDSSVSGSSTGKIEYDPTIGLSDLRVGYRPQAFYTDSSAVRFEAELLGRSAGIDRVTSGGSTSQPKGELNIGAIMLNAFYDLRTGTAFTPFIGIGFGVAGAEFSKHPGLGITDKESTETSLAGQLSIGVSYTPERWPNTDWSIGYSYFRMDGPEFKTGQGRVTLDDIDVSSLQLGFKYHF